ncbi:hypothetical protein C8Q79DRAFT_633382 [Trametes meyenii]|nr:hypothetical protein C8Q79DRAFT_633382 [Trametes meyenii]
MSYDTDPGGRRIPTLVQYCQRVASAHVDSFERLGDMPETLIRPVLNSCSADTLRRLQVEDPYIASLTSGTKLLRMRVMHTHCLRDADIWKALCLKTWPLLDVETIEDSLSEWSWQEEYDRRQEQEQQRLQQITAKLRNKRQRDEEQKKASSIKITDKLPPTKKARWGLPSAPKTLFQKTKSDAARLQKGVYSTLMTRPTHQQRTIVSNSASARLPPPPAQAPVASGSRVTVRSVPVPRQPRPAVGPSGVPAPARAAAVRTTTAGPSSFDFAASVPPTSAASPPRAPPVESDNRSPPSPSRPPAKKTPGSNLFMPKHRAYSQLPRGVHSKT